MQYPTIVGFPDFSQFSPWWEVSKTDTFSLQYVFYLEEPQVTQPTPD